jgi:hypothetical protein
MAALFFLKVSNAEMKKSSLAEGILMIVLIVITIFAQVSINRVFNRKLVHEKSAANANPCSSDYLISSYVAGDTEDGRAL